MDDTSQDEDLETHLVDNYKVVCIDWYPLNLNDGDESEEIDPNQGMIAWC